MKNQKGIKPKTVYLYVTGKKYVTVTLRYIKVTFPNTLTVTSIEQKVIKAVIFVRWYIFTQHFKKSYFCLKKGETLNNLFKIQNAGGKPAVSVNEKPDKFFTINIIISVKAIKQNMGESNDY